MSIYKRLKNRETNEGETVELQDKDSTNQAFVKHCDDRYTRRRGRSKSIDINAVQSTLSEMGYQTTAAEIFEILKDYQSPSGEPGQIEFDQFKALLNNIRQAKQNDPILKSAFCSLGAADINDTISISRIISSLEILKQCNVDAEKLTTICQGREEEKMTFNEFAACFHTQTVGQK